jgi:hypothetical protein
MAGLEVIPGDMWWDVVWLMIAHPCQIFVLEFESKLNYEVEVSS